MTSESALQPSSERIPSPSVDHSRFHACKLISSMALLRRYFPCKDEMGLPRCVWVFVLIGVLVASGLHLMTLCRAVRLTTRRQLRTGEGGLSGLRVFWAIG